MNINTINMINIKVHTFTLQSSWWIICVNQTNNLYVTLTSSFLLTSSIWNLVTMLATQKDQCCIWHQYWYPLQNLMQINPQLYLHLIQSFLIAKKMPIHWSFSGDGKIEVYRLARVLLEDDEFRVSEIQNEVEDNNDV